MYEWLELVVVHVDKPTHMENTIKQKSLYEGQSKQDWFKPVSRTAHYGLDVVDDFFYSLSFLIRELGSLC